MCEGFWQCEVSGQIATWLAAIGTLLAVVVALSGNWWRAKLHGPKLSLTLRQSKGVPVASRIRPPAGDPNPERIESSRYYHVLVVNNRPRSPATQVQVYMTELQELHRTSGEFRTSWAGDIPLQWRYQHARPAFQTVGEGAVDCDLCSVVRDKWLAIHPHPDTLPVGLHTRWRPTNGPCEIVLTLQARGIEAVSEVTKFRIRWDGQWANEDAEMFQHLTVKVLK